MTRVWEPFLFGIAFVCIGLIVVALNVSLDDLRLTGLYWFGYSLAGIGGFFLQVAAIAWGVQIGNRDR